MKKFFACIVALAAMTFAANAADYSIDDASVDAAIENAMEVSSLEAIAQSDITSASLKICQGVNPIVAWALSFIPVTGWLGVHRMYMGTSPLAVILNIVTGAGFGIVYVVDWVVLLIDGVIDGSVSAYCNNPRWWMWADII